MSSGIVLGEGDINMNTVKSYFAENKKIFAFSFFIWFAALICGMYCAAHATGERYDDIFSYTDTVISNTASFSKILKNGLTINVKFVIITVISSSLFVFLPFTCALVMFKGFSAGFTVAFLLRAYAWRGAVFTFFTIVLPYVFSLPVYFLIFVSSIKFPIERIRRRGHSSLSDGRRAWFEYGVLMIAACVLLCVITFFEVCISVLVMHVIK